MKTRVLFLCTATSARSQMAEGTISVILREDLFWDVAPRKATQPRGATSLGC